MAYRLPKMKNLRNWQSENNSERVERIIRDNKVFDVLKKEIKLDMIELPYQEWVDKMNEKTQHEVEHHH